LPKILHLYKDVTIVIYLGQKLYLFVSPEVELDRNT
jgi:hypothetical protein